MSIDIAENSKQESIVWFWQIINNVCDLYAILHAIYNIENRKFINTSRHKNQIIFSLTSNDRIEFSSFLSHLCARFIYEQKNLFNNLTNFDAIYKKVALRDITTLSSTHDKIDLHYVCFVKSFNNSIYKMNDDINELIKTNITLKHDENMLIVLTFKCVKHCIVKKNNDELFNFLTLVSDFDSSD